MCGSRRTPPGRVFVSLALFLVPLSSPYPPPPSCTLPILVCMLCPPPIYPFHLFLMYFPSLFSTPALVSQGLCGAFSAGQRATGAPALPLPASPIFFLLLTCFVVSAGLRVSNPFLGGFGHPPRYLKPRSLPPQPILSLHFVCVLPSLCFIFNSNSLLLLGSSSVFEGESLQLAHFFGEG